MQDFVTFRKWGLVAWRPLELELLLLFNLESFYFGHLLERRRLFRAMQVFGRRTAGALQAAARRQSYSTSTSGYAATAENLRINKDTKLIYQGFTGRQGRYEQMHEVL